MTYNPSVLASLDKKKVINSQRRGCNSSAVQNLRGGQVTDSQSSIVSTSWQHTTCWYCLGRPDMKSVVMVHISLFHSNSQLFRCACMCHSAEIYEPFVEIDCECAGAIGVLFPPTFKNALTLSKSNSPLCNWMQGNTIVSEQDRKDI